MKRWFLPYTPDVLGTLHLQAATTIAGVDAFVAWAGGDASQADAVRKAEHEADVHRRELQRQLLDAFTVPFDAEDLFVLSERLDTVMNGAKNTVREAEVMGMMPNEHLATMAGSIAAGVRHLAAAFDALRTDREKALTEADAAIGSARTLEKAYRQAMSETLQIQDVRDLFGWRELYRRCARLGDGVESVAERVWYAVVKQG